MQLRTWLLLPHPRDFSSFQMHFSCTFLTELSPGASDASNKLIVNFASLPADLLLGVLDHLDPCARGRLARTSYSFYSIVMEFVLRENIQQHKSSMLYWVANKDQKRLVQNLLARGADIDTE
jgi:hypothetical protein